MSFHDIRFPAALSFGSTGGPERRTEIVTLANGFEERNAPWSQSRRRYDAGVSLRSLDDIAALLSFFEAREGQLHGFRWKDWADYTSALPSADVRFTDQLIARGDGRRETFQLIKVYTSGQQSHDRVITKPVAGTVRIGVNGSQLQEGVHFDVDLTTGMVVLAEAPADQAEVTAGFEFDVPVRFDTDHIATSVASFQAGDMPSVPVVELRV